MHYLKLKTLCTLSREKGKSVAFQKKTNNVDQSQNNYLTINSISSSALLLPLSKGSILTLRLAYKMKKTIRAPPGGARIMKKNIAMKPGIDLGLKFGKAPFQNDKETKILVSLVSNFFAPIKMHLHMKENGGKKILL